MYDRMPRRTGGRLPRLIGVILWFTISKKSRPRRTEREYDTLSIHLGGERRIGPIRRTRHQIHSHRPEKRLSKPHYLPYPLNNILLTAENSLYNALSAASTSDSVDLISFYTIAKLRAARTDFCRGKFPRRDLVLE